MKFWAEFQVNQPTISDSTSLAHASGLSVGRALYFIKEAAPIALEAAKLIPILHSPALPFALLKFALNTCDAAIHLYNATKNKNNETHTPNKEKP